MAKFIPVDVFDLVIFGGAGDLALRKLMPALYHRDLDGQLPGDCRIVSIGRRPLSQDEFLAMVARSLKDNLSESKYSPESWQAFSKRLQYVKTDALDASSPNRSMLVEPLSERECDVLKLIAAGHTNREIANTLVISLNTVKKHTTHIYGKMGVKNRTQAIAKAREIKLIF